MKKRVLCTLMSMIMVMGLFTGCGTEESADSPAENVTAQKDNYITVLVQGGKSCI